MRIPLLLAACGLVTAAGLGTGHGRRDARDRFDHPQHARVFPTCVTCHAVQAGGTPWPDPQACATCHDGTIRRPTDWEPPATLPGTNLRFDHGRHAERTAARGSTVNCVDCHADVGAPWMSVRLAVVPRCLTCHQVGAAHFAAPDSACATCHLTLASANRETRERIAAFPKPPSHDRSDYQAAAAHGAEAARSTVSGAAVAASCATCHARDFCTTCHVDAGEQRTIQALATDSRSLAISAPLVAPATHGTGSFLSTHGAAAARSPKDCRTCHTQESCLVCHAAASPAVGRLIRSSEQQEVSSGARVRRRRPESHGTSFTERHGPVASATPAACAGCHVQADCLQCHRPTGGTTSSYHTAGFLARHPSAAYARETSCTDCHNPGAFCQTCHLNAGLTSRSTLTTGRYHDAKQFFIAGHGQAARQSLETCVSCHVERDCLTCHSALGARRFNPHGPGFDAERLRKANPGVCTVCHGADIPGAP